MDLLVEVLVVDDSPVDRRLVGGLLERQSYLTVGYASDGADALNQIERQAPDIVVTDLRMPGTDGLELVRIMHQKFPRVPVVLMTGHGSEDIAREALKEGAAGFVPKCRLAEELTPTVTGLLARVRGEHSQQRLIDCMEACARSFLLENDESLIHALVDDVEQNIRRMGLFGTGEELQIGSALEAALHNALYRGNLEIPSSVAHKGCAQEASQRRESPEFRQRRIRVAATLDGVGARFVVRDDGPGFAHVSSHADVDPDAISESSRGQVLMRAYMDDVEYNETGNQVTLVKYRNQPKPSPA